jgi:FAD/FMN-containing dehydrogenase
MAFSLFVLNRIFYRLNRTRSQDSDIVPRSKVSTNSEKPATLQNFGRNVSFCPEFQEQPADEAELLAILQRHVGRRIRAHGSLHSWSRVPVATDVAINVNQMNGVRLNLDPEEPTATVQAGCQIKKLIFELNQSGWTTPTLGLITEQTIAGATATATHGSGRHCLSHYIRSMRLATYDAQGSPVIRDITAGEELQAACCSLGALGIVTEVVIPIRPQYFIEEHFQQYAQLDAVLEAEAEYPLQQFFLIPWKWTFLVQHRREAKAVRSWHAPLYRAYWTWGMDHGLHWIIIAIARWLPDFSGPLAFRALLPFLVPRRWRVVDRSDRQLTMQHQLYRHIETELFVTKSRLAEMLSLTRWLLQYSAGENVTDHDVWAAAINDCGLSTQFKQLKGSYRHHYPICIRKVQADNGLITMSGSDGDEPWYAISFISYVHPDQRAGFFLFSEFITLLSIHLYSCRPHWGKHHELSPDAWRKLYPQYGKFQEIRDRLDPTNAFLPDWMCDRSES